MKPKALFAAVLAVALCLTGCSTLPKSVTGGGQDAPLSQSSTVSSDPFRFSLRYSGTDVLNPYTAKTGVNYGLSGLLYEGLTAMDDHMEPQLSLAASVQAEDPLHPSAVLREDALFSDGTAVTAADVAASFALAKTSAQYASLLALVESAEARDSRTVVFTFSSNEPNYLACLSFPVLKADSVSDGTPVGSGPYRYKAGDIPQLESNPYASAKPNLEPVYLVASEDDSTAVNGLDSGTYSFVYSDLSGGEVPRTSGANLRVPLNYLVFLGINAGKADFAKSGVRLAISAALSRNTLASAAYSGWATAAVSPFPTQWTPASAIKGWSAGENIAVAVAHLSQAGYNTEDGEVLSCCLLVNEDNPFRTAAARSIAEQLSAVGFAVEVEELAFDEYTRRIKQGDYDLYLGEIRLTEDMSLRPFFAEDGAAAKGIAADSLAKNAYGKYLAGESTLEEFIGAFAADMPFVPLCWRQGLAAYDRALGGVNSTAFNPFYDVVNWTAE